jgi:hypothetical protein
MYKFPGSEMPLFARIVIYRDEADPLPPPTQRITTLKWQKYGVRYRLISKSILFVVGEETTCKSSAAGALTV